MNQKKRKPVRKPGQAADKTVRSAKKKHNMQTRIKIGAAILIGLTVLLAITKLIKPDLFDTKTYREREDAQIDATKPEIDVQLLTVNEYSRPGLESERITGIVMHYTANPGSTAMQNRDYFEGLKDSHETEVSSHFVIGLDGEIVQCVPTWEIAYASNSRNKDTVSIECCHPDESGVFREETYRSMVQLVAWLCQKFDLTEQDVIRHYDVTGKNCPKYFVEEEAAWIQFRADVKSAMEHTTDQNR